MLSLNLHFIHCCWYHFHEQWQQVNTYSNVVITVTIRDSSASKVTSVLSSSMTYHYTTNTNLLLLAITQPPVTA